MRDAFDLSGINIKKKDEVIDQERVDNEKTGKVEATTVLEVVDEAASKVENEEETKQGAMQVTKEC